MLKCFFADEIADDTWAIRESRNINTLKGGWVTAYLLIGSKRAIMIDTGFGKDNIKEFAQTLTDKPITMCALTHGHADHAGGIRYFETIYAERKAEQVFRDSGKASDGNVVYISDGSIIELGERNLEVFVLEGHSPGSVAFLDRRERILFTGDNIGDRNREADADGGMLWYAKTPELQPSLLEFMQRLAKVLACRQDYDQICWGHGCNPLGAEIVDCFMIAALRALDGHVDEQAPQETDYDGGPKFQKLEYKRVSQVGNARILYDKRFMYEKSQQLEINTPGRSE